MKSLRWPHLNALRLRILCRLWPTRIPSMGVLEIGLALPTPRIGIVLFPWSSLKGFLTPELRYLGCLQELHLRNNLLLGAIPMEIGMLKNLTLLDLSVNRLTGPIPPMLGELTAITKLDLHSNGLTGKIPPELGKLKNLVEMLLDRNRLEGQIPRVTMSNFSSTLHAMSLKLFN